MHCVWCVCTDVSVHCSLHILRLHMCTYVHSDRHQYTHTLYAMHSPYVSCSCGIGTGIARRDVDNIYTYTHTHASATGLGASERISFPSHTPPPACTSVIAASSIPTLAALADAARCSSFNGCLNGCLNGRAPGSCFKGRDGGGCRRTLRISCMRA